MGDTLVAAPKKAYVYFANLDGIRAVAAFMVVISHIEYHKNLYGLQRINFLNLQNFGKVGVSIFFALSGFLISYLLLEEKNKFNKIGLKDFYIRRILRIWPLYFLLVIFGFFIYPAQGSHRALLLSIFFMPNLAFCLALLPSIFDPIWSIGTEEQFYIFHPHIFRIKKVEHIFYTLIGITVALIGINLIVRAYQHQSVFMTDLSQFLYYARFDNMMIGAIVAVLYFNTKHNSFNFKFQALFNLLFNKYMQGFLLLVFVVFVYLFLRKEIAQGDLVIALLASLLIVNLCEEQSSILNLSNSKLTYCGKISYGIYLLHKYPLFLMYYLVKTYMPVSGLWGQNLVIYIGTFVTVIVLACISYFGFERYFLRIKSRFQKISQSKRDVVA
jgi:peptidoglycan/LPS O-acetylase OafA/YrhL